MKNLIIVLMLFSFNTLNGQCDTIWLKCEDIKGCIKLDTTMTPVYRERWIVAEEGSSLTQGSAEWSYGNGAVGYMGEVVDNDWEICSIFFTADTYAATATVSIDVMNYGNIASNAAANTIATISLASSVDGGGTTNNAYKYVDFATPIPIIVTGNATIVGFITRTVSGSVSDGRVGVKIRKKVGDYVSDVSID